MNKLYPLSLKFLSHQYSDVIKCYIVGVFSYRFNLTGLILSLRHCSSNIREHSVFSFVCMCSLSESSRTLFPVAGVAVRCFDTNHLSWWSVFTYILSESVEKCVTDCEGPFNTPQTHIISCLTASRESITLCDILDMDMVFRHFIVNYKRNDAIKYYFIITEHLIKTCQPD